MACSLRLASFLALALSSCLPPKGGDASSVKFDKETSRSLATVQNFAASKICTKNTIFLYFGNAEPISTARGGFESSASALAREVKVVAEDLKASLARLSIACSAKLGGKTDPTPHALLVTVTDGPLHGDSQIRTAWFTFDVQRAKGFRTLDKETPFSPGWYEEDAAEWTFIKNQMKEGSKPFELSLPDAILPISEFFLHRKPPNHSGAFEFDQTTYVFKTHGVEFIESEKPFTRSDVYKALVGDSGTKKGTAFLFDPHGEDALAKQASGLFLPTLDLKDCQQLASATRSSDKAPGALCGKCAEQLKGQKNLGAFASCDFPWAEKSKASDEPKLGANTDSTLGANTDSTLGANTDSTLGANTDSTLGANTDSTLGANTDSTLGANTDSTLGANTDSTLGANTDTTLGSGVGSTLGTGKGTAFSSAPADSTIEAKPLARAVIYSGTGGVANVSNVALPIRGTRELPALVILDSCHGKADVGLSLFRPEKDARIVTVSNQNSMGLNAMRYRFDSMAYADYLAFAYVHGAQSDKGLTQYKRFIDRHLADEGVSVTVKNTSGGKEVLDTSDVPLQSGIRDVDVLQAPDSIIKDENWADLRRLSIHVIENGVIRSETDKD